MSVFPVDIIVPVYVPTLDTLSLVKACLESVVEKTKGSYRLVVIDDCSPLEQETKDMLNSFYHSYKSKSDIEIVYNQKNKGFVGTVNVGMGLHSKNDVVLLNNDTEVTFGWLTKMKECAYSDNKIATVSPFSNAATILSIPEFLKDNPLPKGYSAEDMSRIVEKYSPKLYPELPTAHGFCMYIKRAVLDELGVFDEETFGKGYGEENDFSCRCIANGYINVLDDQTFVYHKGEASFQGEKASVVDLHLKILSKRYPFYLKSVHQFIQNKPLSLHHEIFGNLLSEGYKVTSEKPLDSETLLILTHGFGGGTQKYLDDLIRGIRSDLNVFTVKAYRTHFEIVFPDQKTVRTIKHPFELIDYNLASSAYFKSLFSDLITKIQPDNIYVNSLILSSCDIVEVAKENEIPITYILHDYNLICPTNHFIDNKDNYCGVCKFGEERPGCLVDNQFYWIGEMSALQLNYYRNYIKNKVLPLFTKIISPSEAAKRIVQEFYNDINIDITVIPHVIEGTTLETKPYKVKNKEVLKIGVIGSIGRHKGIDSLSKVLKKIKNNNVQFYLFGASEYPLKNIVDKGVYKNDELYGKLLEEGIDIVLLPSIWPETFMYTLSECIELKIPVITTHLGAPAERVLKNDIGWVVDTTDVKAVIELVNEIEKDREHIVLKQNNMREVEPPSFGEYIQGYLGLFKDLSNHQPRSSSLFYHDYFNKSHEEMVVLGEGLSPEFLTLSRKMKKFARKTKVIYVFRGLVYSKKNGLRKTVKKLLKSIKDRL